MGRNIESAFPSRVIDVLGRDGQSVTLVEKESISQNTGSYATLSHCWGKARLLTTLKSTFAKYKQGILWGALPKTFQDAILIVRALGLRYISIDSLCIIQDDDDDWRKQSVLMADVYSNSYLNIAATGSSDSRGGCFGSRTVKYGISKSLDIAPQLISLETGQQSSENIYVRPSFEEGHHRFITPTREQFNTSKDSVTPLLTRAWVFQERQLAPRTVHFHPSEMIMECKAVLRCECTVLDRLSAKINKNSPDHDLNLLDESEVLGKWFEIVEEYSRLHLTKESDRLIAVAGVATIFQKRLKCRYLAGIWQCDIARGLLWSVSRYTFSNSKRSMIRPKKPCAPSWSWASLILDQRGTSIVFRSTPGDSFSVHEQFRYVDHMGTADPNIIPDLRIDSRIDRIQVQGLLTSAKLVHNIRCGPLLRRRTLVLRLGPGAKESSIDIESQNSTGMIETFVPSGTIIFCLLVGTKTVLNPREDTQMIWLCTLVCKAAKFGVETIYKRIGIFDVWEGASVFYGATEKIIAIV
ncbi:hypothetical protein SBOR_2998 [Sclerotinia borealis F-4128]|uniref:Heterokaryon incompatibility domain-containing protein n=1 Tax=Sclerotinia borealis (strain F-4128) TaxID=1432307 RepID=W9CL99_SCLBF|nr:hypothetical protein SBOR_2998 [Sclerotinia borealis F-4128]